jgi:predicted DNA-binding protein (UPF0251 family)
MRRGVARAVALCPFRQLRLQPSPALSLAELAEVMRLMEEVGYSQRGVAEKLGISKTTVNCMAKRCGDAPGERHGTVAP